MFALGDLCHDALPTFLALFDLSIAPQLLFYSYVPIVIVSVIIAFFIYTQDKKSLQTRLFLSLIIFFVAWVVNVLVQWIGAYNSIIMFAWQLTVFFEMGIYLSALYLCYVYLFERDISEYAKPVLAVIAIGILVLLPTHFNILAYDADNCQGISGPLWSFMYYIFEPLTIVTMIAISIASLRVKKPATKHWQSVVFATGLILFTAFFFISNAYGELSQDYAYNLWGPIGLVCFFALLGYLVVEYNAFNAKLFGAQALVFGLTALIGSEIFFVHTAVNRILVSVTFLFSVSFGYLLVRSVRHEIEQRLFIEKQKKDLEAANIAQENLLHFMSHEIKGYLAKSEAAFAAIVEGDYGTVTDELKHMTALALSDVRKGVCTVMDILDASNLKKGTVSFAQKQFDLNAAVDRVVNDLRIAAEDKHLELRWQRPETTILMKGDEEKLVHHVIRNLIDNSIKYTPQGSVSVSLEMSGKKALLTVQDTGIGITSEDMARLFTEGGRGKDSIKVNVHSTGFGLYIAKQVVDAHKGTIKAESEGAGKGSRFVVELPTL